MAEVNLNRRRDKLKILAWMGDGFTLYMRRLERDAYVLANSIRRRRSP